MRYYDKLNLSPRVVEVCGKFPLSQVAVAPTASWTFDTAKVATFTSPTSANNVNLLTYSEVFDNAAWTKLDSTNDVVTADQATNPVNGALTADAVVAYTSDVAHGVTQAATLTVATYVLSVYAKKGAKDWLYMKAASNKDAYFNLATGVIGTCGSAAQAAIVDCGYEGWYRCDLIFAGTVASYTCQIGPAHADADNDFVGTGAAVSCYLFGAELVQSADFCGYVATTSAAAGFSVRILDTSAAQNANCITDPSGTGNIDCYIYTMDRTAASPTISFFNHGVSGGGVSIYETATQLVVMYETAVSTVAQVKAAINASTYWRAYGGTAANVLDTTSTDECIVVSVTGTTLNAWLSTDSATSLVCSTNVSTATYANVASVVNECGSGKVSVSSAASGTVTAALAATTLSGGVTAVALDSTLIGGEGFSVARSGAAATGEYTVTFDRGWSDAQLLSMKPSVQLPSGEKMYPQLQARAGLYSSANKTLVFTAYNPRTPAVIDPPPATGRFIHFQAKFIVNR